MEAALLHDAHHERVSVTTVCMGDGGWFNRWGDTAAGLAHRFAAAWMRVRAAFGDG